MGLVVLSVVDIVGIDSGWVGGMESNSSDLDDRSFLENDSRLDRAVVLCVLLSK